MIEKVIQVRYRVVLLSLALALLATAPAFAAPVEGDTASSTGAGYETTGDMLVFKNKKKGAFIATRASDGTFEVQTLRQPIKPGSRKIYNRAVGVKANVEGDRLVYNTRTQLLTLNGSPVEMENPSSLDLPNGGSVEASGSVYTITSEVGDKATLTVVGKIINLEVQAASTREGGDMKGSLGQFDSDTDPTNDLAHPGDVQAASSGEWSTTIKVFLEAWRILLFNSMFV
jgi:hypothetical protein